MENINRIARLPILVVEDNVSHALLTRTLLELLECSYDIVNYGAGALNAIQQTAYQAVLMDSVLSDMSGFEAVEQIRTYEAQNSLVPLPIIAVTVDPNSEFVAACKLAGIDEYLRKPFSIDAIKACLDRIVR